MAVWNDGLTEQKGRPAPSLLRYIMVAPGRGEVPALWVIMRACGGTLQDNQAQKKAPGVPALFYGFDLTIVVRWWYTKAT